MSSTQWQPLVARAADTPSLSQRGRLWLEAIDQTGSTAAEGPLDAFSPPEATGMVDSGGSSAAHVYRLGVLGYAIFAGGIPWKERTADELVHSILTEHLPAFSYSDWPSIFQGRINRIIARATEKDPGARFAGLRELRVAVTGALAVLDEERTETEHRPRLHREAYRHIDRWLHRARAGTVAALAVVGTSGIGKTYLWETVRDAHARPGERWLYVKAGQVAQRPYETITLLLESVRDDIAALVADDRVSPLVRAFLHAIAPHIVPAGSLEEASEVRDPAGELAHIIRYIGATADFRVVCFDDFQWIDPYSRQVIEALVHGPDQLPVVTLSRGDIPRSITSDIVYLKPLSREHAWEFARAQSSTTGPVLQDTFDRAFALSAGNPMVLQSVLSAGASEVPADAEDVLVVVALQRLANVSAACRSVLSLIALVGMPVSHAFIARSGEFTDDATEAAVAEAERAQLVRRHRLHDSVRFSHDSIETAARRFGENDPRAVQRAIQVLIAAARAGNDRAAYTAIALLPTVPPENIAQDDWNWVLTAAARRAVNSLAPLEALRIVREWRNRTSPSARLVLYQIAHEAAYLLADRREMSRYYRAIVAVGDSDAAAEARYLWIRRCYADARFPGAVAVGVQILSDASVIEESFEWASDGAEAAHFLHHHSPQYVLTSILRHGYSTDRAVSRATDTLGRMLLPVLTSDRDHLAHLAYYTLRIAMECGATRLTALGVIAWVHYLANSRTPGRWVNDYMVCAQRLAALSGDPLADHSVRTLCTAFGAPWTESYRAFAEQAERLQSEGRDVGNWEFTAHALHIHRQALLYRGEPLETMRDILSETRREVRSFGLERTDSTLAKYQAATDALLGYTDDPTSLDGSVIREDDYFRRIVERDDQMSLAGFRITKAFLLLYADRPEGVFEHLTALEQVVPAISLFHDMLFARFYRGIAAYRTNRLEVGDRMLRIVRRWARENPATHHHRLMFLRAERAALRGRGRSARRLLDRAFPLAVRAGFSNEAALIAERAGDISGAAQYWMAAESAYRQWGAVHAVARVRRKLGKTGALAASPRVMIPGEDLHRDLTRAQSMEDAMNTVARSLFAATYAAQVVIVFTGESEESTSAYSWTGTEMVRLGGPSSDLSLILSETSAGEHRLLTAQDALRSASSGVVGRSARVHDSEVAAIVLAAADGAPYAYSVVEMVRSILRVAALHAALLSAQARIGARESQLRETRDQLSATERYRRQLFSTVTDAFALMDHAGAVLFSNPAAEPFLDREVPSKTVLRRDLRDAVHALIAPASGPSGGVVSRGVLRHRTDDQRHVQIQTAPVAPGDEDLVAVSISDITDAVERETRLSQQERQLVVADRLASIGMFSASIVHEISNPNHILQLNTQSLLVVLSWLRSEVADEYTAATVAQASDLVEQIEDAAQRVESVLQMVKSYSREGRRERWGVHAPDTICARAFRFSKIMASQYTDHFRLTMNPELGYIWGEEALLEQALVNLIKNACEALPARDGRVELQAYRTTDEVVLAVCDSGDGFPQELSQALGTPFVSSRHDDGGTGLGLSIVAGIVEKHSGYLHVQGDDRFTTRVEVHLPAYVDPAGEPFVSSD